MLSMHNHADNDMEHIGTSFSSDPGTKAPNSFYGSNRLVKILQELESHRRQQRNIAI